MFASKLEGTKAELLNVIATGMDADYFQTQPRHSNGSKNNQLHESAQTSLCKALSNKVLYNYEI